MPPDSVALTTAVGRSLSFIPFDHDDYDSSVRRRLRSSLPFPPFNLVNSSLKPDCRHVCIMTSQQLWDTQKSSSVLPEARPVAQSSHASHTSSGSRQQPQQQQVFIDLTQTDQEGPAEEPPAKRQKFDLSLSLPGNLSLPANNIPRGPLNAPSPLPSTPLRTPRPALPVRGKPTWDYQSPQSDEEDLSPHSPDSFSVIDRHVPTPPPLPQRPWSHRATRNVATPAPVARPALPVVIVPYVSEPRGVAPDCGNKSKSSNTVKICGTDIYRTCRLCPLERLSS